MKDNGDDRENKQPLSMEEQGLYRITGIGDAL